MTKTNWQATWACVRCGEVKPADNRHFRNKRRAVRGIGQPCLECMRQDNLRYREVRLGKNPSVLREDAWRALGIRNADGSFFLQRDYDVIWRNQGGRCGLCGSLDSGSKNGFHVDHDHDTGIVRGILCKSCNSELVASLERLIAAGLLERALEYVNYA